MSKRQTHTTLDTLCEEPVSHYRQGALSCVLVALSFDMASSLLECHQLETDHLLSILVGDILFG